MSPGAAQAGDWRRWPRCGQSCRSAGTRGCGLVAYEP